MDSSSSPSVERGQTLLRFRVQPLEYIRRFYSYSVAGAIAFVITYLLTGFPLVPGVMDSFAPWVVVLLILLIIIGPVLLFLFLGSRVCTFVYFSEKSHAIIISGVEPLIIYGPFKYSYFLDGRRHFLYLSGYSAGTHGEQDTPGVQQTLVLQGLPRVIDSTPANAERIESLMLPEEPPTPVFETLTGTARLVALQRLCRHHGGENV